LPRHDDADAATPGRCVLASLRSGIRRRTDSESFAAFLHRVETFHRRLLDLDAAFVVAVGHGQFFSAYRYALARGFEATPAWMRDYRATETASPLRNGEFIRLQFAPGRDARQVVVDANVDQSV
jgi:broad specificity phosphatase PhoE